jgi:PTH1 family peptidyl-tRNA hydrolase
MGVKLVVGLGNPGRKYTRTRHNVGFRVLDVLADRLGAAVDKKRFEALYTAVPTPAGRVVLVAPQTYMNLSGRAVGHFLRYFKAEAGGVLVVCDDIALPLGTIRLRARGSSGGQKGLASVLRELGTQEVSRLRVGVGAPPGQVEAADYVLGRFTEDDERTLGPVLQRAADCVEVWLAHGAAEAMNRFNAKPEREPETKQEG